MSRQYELSTMSGYSKQCFLPTREERARFGKIAGQWRLENPKPTVLQSMLFERILTLHIQIQRLLDRRQLWSGEKTDYCSLGGHVAEVSEADMEQKHKEYDNLMAPLMKQWTDLMKLAMANDIRIDVSGDVSELFSALDKKNDSKNGSSNSEKT